MFNDNQCHLYMILPRIRVWVMVTTGQEAQTSFFLMASS